MRAVKRSTSSQNHSNKNSEIREEMSMKFGGDPAEGAQAGGTEFWLHFHQVPAPKKKQIQGAEFQDLVAHSPRGGQTLKFQVFHHGKGFLN